MVTKMLPNQQALKPVPTASPVKMMNWQAELPKGNTTAQTRGVGYNEQVDNQLNDLTSSDSRYLQIARDNAMRAASGRGMMMGTMAAGNAERAAIEAALPIAQQDATTYARTASENMGAVNADRLADQNMYGNLLGQAVGIRANLDEAERNRGWQSNENISNRNWQTGERVGTQTWQTGERLGQQNWQTGERVAGQQFQTSERRDTQNWQSGENKLQRNFTTQERVATQGFQKEMDALQRNWQGSQNQIQRLHELNLEKQKIVHDAAMRQLDRNFQGTEQEKQRLQQRFTDFNQSMMQQNINLTNTLSAIYSNTALTGEQQAAAANNARAVHASLFNSYASTMSSGMPQIFYQPYQMPAGTPQPTVQPRPQILDPAAAYLAANPDVAKDPYFAKNPLLHYQQYGQNEGRTWG